MGWSDVHGEIWFWIAAAIVWGRAAMSAFGVPRKLIVEGRRARGARLFARDLVRYRLGRGRPIPIGLAALRWPALGAATAYAIASAAVGDVGWALPVLAALGPIAAASLALEPRMQAALDAIQAAEEQGRGAEAVEGALVRFADILEQAWRLRLAATGVAVAASVVVGTLLKG